MRLPPSFLILATLCLSQLSAEVAITPKDQPAAVVDDELWNVHSKDWSHAASYDLAQSAAAPLPLENAQTEGMKTQAQRIVCELRRACAFS